jgi:hypothetical protein
MFGKNSQEKRSNKPERPSSPGFIGGLRRWLSWPRWVSLAIVYFALLTAFGIIGGYSLHDASAANWSGPTNNPPQGNIPIPVWNYMDTNQTQSSAAVDVAGHVYAGKDVSAGSAILDLDVSDPPNENIYFGAAAYDLMSASDSLLLLQTVKNSIWTSRFRVNKDGDVSAAGCFGPVFIGTTTPSKFKGDLSPSADRGYYLANSKCNTAYTGSHICSTAEMLNSIKCGASALFNALYNGTDAWIQDGPPGYTAPANDCQGWQSQVSTDLGRIWRFDSTKAGKGFLTTCNQDIVFACCR